MLKECRTCKWWKETFRVGRFTDHYCMNRDAPMNGETTSAGDCCNLHEDRPDPFEDEEVEDE